MLLKFKKRLERLGRKRVGIHIDSHRNIFLHRNERVVPYDDEVLDKLYERLRKVNIHQYPDIELFYKRLSDWLGVSEGKIFITEGVSGAIKSLMETLCEPGENIITPTPTFALYPVYSRMHDLEYRTFGYTEDYKFDLNKLESSIDKNTSMVFLPNPNVPIEGTLSLDKIRSIAEFCLEKKVYLVLDEVYYPFGGPTGISLVDTYDNVFVMRSFSKAFGLAGVRVGYLLGNEKNIEYVSKIRTGYETSSVSAEIVSFFIDNYDAVDKNIKDTKKGLDYLKSELKKRKIAYNGGDCSNFIFVDFNDPKYCAKLSNELEEKGIYVRAGWPEPYNGGFSVTGGPERIMRKFIKELFAIMEKVR